MNMLYKKVVWNESLGILMDVSELDNGNSKLVKIDKNILNNNGLIFASSSSITNVGIDAGSKAILNVAAGVSVTEDVNLNLLQSTQATVATNYYGVNNGGGVRQ